MSKDSLKRAALITGASKGLGLELCKRLYQQGFFVAAIARDISPVLALESDWARGSANTNGEIFAHAADATDHKSVVACVEEVVERFGHLDILINNVGGLPTTGIFTDLSLQDWQDCFEQNVLSAVNFSKACYPHLRASSSARIVNMTSITAIEPGAFNPHYSASKAALLNLSKHLSNAWAEDGILVNSIAAGPFDSPSLREVIKAKASEEGRDLSALESEFIGDLAARIPLGRLGSIHEIAELTLFLISEQSGWMTGSNICIDGGKHRSIF